MPSEPARQGETSPPAAGGKSSPANTPECANPDVTADESALPPSDDLSYADAIEEQENPEIAP